ncbi:hypothetical protein F5Y17DRAFT_466822 [Xylariaceae sp. FL0594]|nr:hypothetical protein F5Y17DRAFT_466822 [Xylariaceae sp. FL0594]
MAGIPPYKRELPFIHRAWKTAVDHFPSMPYGIKRPTGTGDAPVAGDQQPRPVKRRRVAEDSPEAARAVPGRLLSKTPDDFEKALRIEVLSITRDNRTGPRPANLHCANGSPEQKDIPVIKARCRVLVCEWGPDLCRVLHSDSQICNFKIFRDSDNICRTARIYLPTPFLIPAAKLSVEFEDDSGFGLSNHYLVRVEIESAGDPKWPPMDLLPRNPSHEHQSGNPRRWVLSSQVVYNFEKGRVTGDVVVRKQKTEIPLNLVMDMDLRWSTCHTATSSGRVELSAPPRDSGPGLLKGVLQPLTNGHVNGRPMVDAEMNDVAEDEEDHEEATTPSRSLRHREKQNYNLKLLSDKARGKERKERKQPKLAEKEREGNGVVWEVPLIGEITLENYDCIRCFATHSSMEQLKSHLNVHTDLKFTIDIAQAHIRILDPEGEASLRLQQSAYHGLPSPENQESDVDDRITPQELPKSHVQSRGRPSQPQPPKTGDKRRLVPYIKQPLYDRLSKSLLEPGSLVDAPPVDDTWLVQKHRDIIRDFTDVHQYEKEYIAEWDAFVNRECVTSEPHLQDAYIRFVREKADWLASSQNRITEWAKHLSYLKARNALTEATILQALSVIRQAKSQVHLQQAESPRATPATSPPCRKSAAGCPECGEPVRAACLICSNLDCDNPLYHKACVGEISTRSFNNRNWLCKECSGPPKTTS